MGTSWEYNRVSQVKFPLSISAGITFPLSATIVYSQVFVLLGITNPNSKNKVSTSYPFKYIFWAKLIFSIASWVLNTINLEMALLSNILAGRWTSRSTFGPSYFVTSPHYWSSRNISPVSASKIKSNFHQIKFEFIIHWLSKWQGLTK